jgi:GTP-binding protein
VLKKAFQHELRPIVVINKIDRPDARADEVLNMVFDLFVELGADDETLDFRSSTLRGARARRRGSSKSRARTSSRLRSADEAHPAPHGDIGQGASDPHQQHPVQRLRRPDRRRAHLQRRGQDRPAGRDRQARRHDREEQAAAAQVFDGFGRKNAEEAAAGDIVALIGLDSVDISDSICDAMNPQPLEPEEIEPPTLTMMFSVNTSPFVGKEGKYVTSRNLRERLMKELESNVALKVEESEEKGAFKVSGRGLLHLGHPHREHAPRGLRAVDQQAARDHEARARTAAARADRVPRRRRGRERTWAA